MKILLKVLLALLPLSSYADIKCEPSPYQLEKKSLCFSPTQKTYLSEDCAKGSCQALTLALKKTQADTSKDTSSKHPGAKICRALGGVSAVAVNQKSQDGLCVCVAADSSSVSCDFLSRK